MEEEKSKERIKGKKEMIKKGKRKCFICLEVGWVRKKKIEEYVYL